MKPELLLLYLQRNQYIIVGSLTVQVAVLFSLEMIPL